MATIVYNFIPGDIVWYLTADSGIKQATIILFDSRVIEVSGSPAIETTLMYSIQYTGASGTVEVEGETKLFSVLDDALTAYKAILEA